MSTSDIKKELVEHFNAQGVLTKESDWKRLSKKKDAQGREVREFSSSATGAVVVVDDDGELIISTAGGPVFTMPVFSDEARRAAERIHALYLDIAQGLHEHAGNSDDAAHKICKHPDYLLVEPALPTRLAFMFPVDTYGNEGDQDLTLDDPIGEMCISVLDPTPGADHDLYAHDMISEKLMPLCGHAMDEYHYEFLDQNQTVRQVIQALLNVGLSYNFSAAKDEDQGCMFYQQLKDIMPKREDLPSVRSKIKSTM